MFSLLFELLTIFFVFLAGELACAVLLSFVTRIIRFLGELCLVVRRLGDHTLVLVFPHHFLYK